jgi:hypothetical protein
MCWPAAGPACSHDAPAAARRAGPANTGQCGARHSASCTRALVTFDGPRCCSPRDGGRSAALPARRDWRAPTLVMPECPPCGPARFCCRCVPSCCRVGWGVRSPRHGVRRPSPVIVFSRPGWSRPAPSRLTRERRAGADRPIICFGDTSAIDGCQLPTGCRTTTHRHRLVRCRSSRPRQHGAGSASCTRASAHVLPDGPLRLLTTMVSAERRAGAHRDWELPTLRVDAEVAPEGSLQGIVVRSLHCSPCAGSVIHRPARHTVADVLTSVPRGGSPAPCR